MKNEEWLQAPRGYPEATPRLSGSQPVATRRLPGGYPEATLRLPRGYPEATLRLHLGYPEAPGRVGRRAGSLLSVCEDHWRRKSRLTR